MYGQCVAGLKLPPLFRFWVLGRLYLEKFILWIAFLQLLPFLFDVLIHYNFYISLGYLEVVINDHSCGWFGCWVQSISSFNSDVTWNLLEYGFNFVCGMYLVQELDNQWVFQFFSSLVKSGQIGSLKILWISYVCLKLLDLIPILLHKLLH